MNEEESLKTIEQESFRELRHDGLNEIMTGTIFLSFIVLIVEPGLLSIFVVWSVFAIIVMLFLIFLPQFIEVIRKKYVYPRIGYVKLRTVELPEPTVRNVTILIIMVLTVLPLVYAISIGVITSDLVYRWAPALFGLIWLLSSFYLKDKTGQNRSYLCGILMTITGIAVALVEFISVDVVNLIYAVGWGVTIFVMGVIKFVLFIRKYPIIGTPEVTNSEQ